jgi:hypothetical protein
MNIEHNQLTGVNLHQPFPTGLDSAKSGSPIVGDHYYATDTKRIYECQVAGAWTILNMDLSFVLSLQNVTGIVNLVNDASAPGNNYYYGTNNLGVKGFFGLPATAGMVYPAAGVPVSLGAGWGTSISVGTGAYNLLQLNSNGELPSSVIPVHNQVIFTSGVNSWTCPAGVLFGFITAVGGGAGGGGGRSGYDGGQGGGSGAYGIRIPLKFTPGNTYTITINTGGTGGAENNNGTNGGSVTITSDSGTLTFNGGIGGGHEGDVTGTGVGGAASAAVGGNGTNAAEPNGGAGGLIFRPATIAGFNGGLGHGDGPDQPCGGGGAGSMFGAGGVGVTFNGTLGASSNGQGYGAGGGGGQGGTGSRAGGDGVNGALIIEW